LGTHRYGLVYGGEEDKKVAGKALHWAIPWGEVPAACEWVNKFSFLTGGKNCAKVFWEWELQGIRDGGSTQSLGEQVKGE